MANDYGFVAKRVYTTSEGLHFEHYTEEEAKAAYEDALMKGRDVCLDGLIMTWFVPERKFQKTIPLAG